MIILYLDFFRAYEQILWWIDHCHFFFHLLNLILIGKLRQQPELIVISPLGHWKNSNAFFGQDQRQLSPHEPVIDSVLLAEILWECFLKGRCPSITVMEANSIKCMNHVDVRIIRSVQRKVNSLGIEFGLSDSRKSSP